MQTKDDLTPEESPRKRRTTRAAAAEEAEPKEAPKKRATKAKKAEEPEPKAEKAEPKKRTTRAKKGAEAEEKAEARPEPKAEPRPEPKAERAPEPKPEPVRVEVPRAEMPPRVERAPEPAPAPVAAPPPPAQVSAPPPAAQAQGSQPQGQQQHGQRHHRHERHQRHQRHGQHGQPQGAPQPNGPDGAATAEGGAPVQAQQPHGGHPQQQGQQQQRQPGEPGVPGQGRRRRRRRGRGGGGGGQPGQPGQFQQQQNPQLEAQLTPVQGVLEMDDRGFGKLRRTDKNFMVADNDPDVPKQIVDRYRLRPGALLNAQTLVRNGKPTVHRVDLVEGVTPDEASNRLTFANLTSVDPDRRIQLETAAGELVTRAIDIIAPIGFGQRGLIVAPPKTGKTIILQKMAKAILTNHPKAKLMVLLIDERPEEVTDFKRSIGAEVYASSSDRPAHEHLRIAEMVMERARRLVEAGDDVVVLLDSITRLARAYNKEVESSGRTMSGGVDSRALERPKRIFGAARNTEEAGSLTIIGTALIDTGSRMDEVIFEEFKGTGNMEIVLDRQLAERRLWPAINVNNSGTRKEEKLFGPKENEKIRKLRAYLAALRPVEAMEKLLGRLRDFRSNNEFLEAL